MGLKLENLPLDLQRQVLKQLAQQKPPVGKNKYGAIRTTVGEYTFASKAEANRYSQLKRQEELGLIKDLGLQPPYPMVINGVKCFTYRADFRYTRDDKEIIEDVKGFATPVYKLKKKIIEAAYGIVITEIKK